MNDEQYLEHCGDLIAEFSAQLSRRCASLPEGDPLRELSAGFARLQTGQDSLYHEGASLVTRLFATYPELAPLFPRPLLWFFGGDCLHLMPDDEIAQFQALDDARHEAAARGEVLNLRDARAKLLNLQ